ncbi:MAG: amidoligase family protein [Pseudomonadota bacterium]
MEVDDLLGALRRSCTEGTHKSVAYGFGLHLNLAPADPDGGADLTTIACALAVLEGWFRKRDPLDFSRPALPFVEPFPTAFVAELSSLRAKLDLGGTFDALDVHVKSRNHGLDLLPAYAYFASNSLKARAVDGGSVSPRPTYHTGCLGRALATPPGRWLTIGPAGRWWNAWQGMAHFSPSYRTSGSLTDAMRTRGATT